MPVPAELATAIVALTNLALLMFITRWALRNIRGSSW